MRVAGKAGEFTLNRERRLFSTTLSRKRNDLFPVKVNESAVVIREITNLFLEIREHGLQSCHFS